MHELIDITGDFTPLRVRFGEEPHVILVGHAGGGMARVEANGHSCALVQDGGWSSPPLPYRPGMPVTVVFVTGQGARSEVRADLPGPDKLGPVFGPGWTLYAPLIERNDEGAGPAPACSRSEP